MDCKEAQILMTPHIMGDLDSDSRFHELGVHLLSCQTCSEECAVIRETTGFIDEHKVLFAEALRSIGEKRAAEEEGRNRSWKGIQAKLGKLESQGKWAKSRRSLVRVCAAVAACIAIGVSILLALPSSKTSKEQVSERLPSSLASPVKIELLSEAGRILLPAGEDISTSANELKTLILNDRHRLTMNASSTLSIELFEQKSRFGCMVRLASGEIYARVQHDGNPFVVNTPLHRAVIKGTILDVKATEIGTTLAVSEGTVRFESEKGFVQVKSGQLSRITGQSAPTEPEFCSAVELTAWAIGHEIETASARFGPVSDDYDLSDLWLSASSGPIDLETIDYDSWVEEKRDWFKREFPWIFQFKNALAKEGIKVDYPQLLVQSSDIRQFAYPQVSPRRIPIPDVDSLLKGASVYGFNEQWLLQNVQSFQSAVGNTTAAKGRFAGLEAFEKWAGGFEQLRKSSEEVDSGMLLYSLHASAYLANTRTLAWLSLNRRILECGGKDRDKLSFSLSEGIQAACNLMRARLESMATLPGTCSTKSSRLIEGAIRYINVMHGTEKAVRELRRKEGGDGTLVKLSK
jgi:ferric-dicitrate binding protein FerR (iron transport regulator)